MSISHMQRNYNLINSLSIAYLSVKQNKGGTKWSKLIDGNWCLIYGVMLKLTNQDKSLLIRKNIMYDQLQKEIIIFIPSSAISFTKLDLPKKKESSKTEHNPDHSI